MTTAEHNLVVAGINLTYLDNLRLTEALVHDSSRQPWLWPFNAENKYSSESAHRSGSIVRSIFRQLDVSLPTFFSFTVTCGDQVRLTVYAEKPLDARP